MNAKISRRHFLATTEAVAAFASGLTNLVAGESGRKDIHLGMMLQGDSTDDLLRQAGNIAAVGFDTVQVTFFFEPSADDLKKLAETLHKLGLQVAAFGTYFNPFRPDDTSFFMHSNLRTMKLLVKHSELFGCRQFVSWSGSYAPTFSGVDPRNHTPEAVTKLQRAVRDIVLPILEPITGRVAFEPFCRHVLGSPELGKKIFAPFPADRVGFVMDPPNFISPELYPKRDEEMLRLFQVLGDRIHFVHFKDIKLDSNKNRVTPGPGDGDMNYPLFISELRKLKRPLTGIIEHIKAEPEVMSRAKAWVEARLRQIAPLPSRFDR